MKAANIVRSAKNMRCVKYAQLSQALEMNLSQITARMSSTKNLTTNNFYSMLHALDYVVIAMPKENYEELTEKIKLPNTFVLDDKDDEKVKTYDRRVCPNCGKPLKKAEQKYNGCPYCLTKWENTAPLDMVQEEKEIKEREKKQEAQQKKRDLMELLGLGEE